MEKEESTSETTTSQCVASPRKKPKQKRKRRRSFRKEKNKPKNESEQAKVETNNHTRSRAESNPPLSENHDIDIKSEKLFKSVGHYKEDEDLISSQFESFDPLVITNHRKLRKKGSLRSTISRKVKKKPKITKTSSDAFIGSSIRRSKTSDPDEILPYYTPSIHTVNPGISFIVDTETGNTELTASTPTLMFQTPSLSRMYTVLGAQRQGLFSSSFHIEKVAHPDGIRRNSAISGTLVDLVEWCSFFPGSNIIKYLLLCYRICSEPVELFEALMSLWAMYKERELIDDMFKERCYVFIVQWILLWGGIDFTPDIRASLSEFIDQMLLDFHNGLAVKHIYALLSHHKVISSLPGECMDFIDTEDPSDNSGRTKRKRISRVVTLPLNMLSPRTNEVFNILEYDTQVICDHLTWIESDLFKAIQITEFMNNNWLRENKKILAPNLTNLSDHFNKVSSWVSSLIITASPLKSQIRVFKKFLRLVRKLIAIRNYSTACQVVTGLNNFVVSRLRLLQENISSKDFSRLEHFQALLGPNHNYRNYRTLPLDEPCIPLLPVHLRDIAFIFENESNFVGEGVLNFDKMHSLAMRVYSLYNMKKGFVKFSIETDLALRDKVLTSITGGLDSESLYQASLTIQPISPRPEKLLRRSSSDNTLSLSNEILPEPSNMSLSTPLHASTSQPILMATTFCGDYVEMPDIDE